MLQSICFSSFAIKSAISAMHSTDWLPSINVDASDPYHMGWQIGQRFKGLIKSRMSKDPFLYSQLLPYAATHDGQQLVDALSASNKNLYPRYWSELQGIADGSYTSLLEVLLLNFRKEIMPFVTCRTKNEVYDAEECSDVAICSSLAALGHNEDANVSVQDHIFLVHASLSSEASFTAFTLAGELPSCAFGFNSYGVGFTLNAVPPLPDEVVAGGIGRNFVSRDLLESTCLEVALQCVQLKNLAVGHSYNIFDICSRKIVNVETASRGRFSVKEIGATPFFHANMYRHLDISQDLLLGTTHSVVDMVKALEVPTYHMESSYLSRMEVISSSEILFRSCTSLVAYLWSIRLIHLVDILWSTWRSRMVDTTWRLWIPRHRLPGARAATADTFLVDLSHIP